MKNIFKEAYEEVIKKDINEKTDVTDYQKLDNETKELDRIGGNIISILKNMEAPNSEIKKFETNLKKLKGSIWV